MRRILDKNTLLRDATFREATAAKCMAEIVGRDVETRTMSDLTALLACELADTLIAALNETDGVK